MISSRLKSAAGSARRRMEREWWQYVRARARASWRWRRAELADGPPVLWTAYGAISRRSVCVHRQGELKRGTVGYVCRGPQPATVSFNDRTADREPHAHAAGFGGEEGVEQPVRIRGGYPDAAIRHTYERSVCLVLTRSDHQFARPIRDRLHCFNAIHHQVNDHLLQLDTIGQDYGQGRRQLHSQRHPVAG